MPFYRRPVLVMMLGYREWAIVPLIVAVGASMFFGRPYMFAAFAAMLLATIGITRISKALKPLCTVRMKRIRTARIRVTSIRADPFVSAFKPILNVGIMHRIQQGIEQRAKQYILHSGSVQNPRIIGIKSVLYPAMAGTISIPIVVIVMIVYDTVAIALILVPAASLFVFYFVMLKIRADERRSGVEDEIAHFAALASIMESVNVSLFSTLESIAKSSSDIFPAIKREGKRIQDIAYLGSSPTKALMDLADTHPSMMFRNFLDGYISAFNTGGTDTSKYLQEQSRRFFKFTQARMTRYTKQADMIAQVILTIMLLLPMMGLSMTFFATGPMAESVMLILIMVFPLITVLLTGMVHASQPKRRDSIGTSWLVFVVGGVAGIAVYMLLDSQVWEGIGAGIVAGSLLNAVLVRRSISDLASAESNLPEFMRRITRFKNIGIDIMNAIRMMRNEIITSHKTKGTSKLGRMFDDVIDNLYKAMTAGSSLEAAISKTSIKSWNVRLVFFILGKIHESGGGTTKTLDDITRWVTEYDDARKEMISNLRASLMTAFIGPVLMVMISEVSRQLTSRFESSNIGDGLEFLPYNISNSADVSGLAEILTIVSTACMGVTLSKINYFTVRHTLFVCIVTLVTMVLIYTVPLMNIFEI